MSRAQRPALLAALVLIALSLALGAAWLDYRRFTTTPLTVAETGATFDVPPGTSFAGVVRLLREQGRTAAPDVYWRLLATRLHVTQGLHAGEYALDAALTPPELLHRMAAGEVIQHKFTIVEGWTFRQLREALEREDLLQHVAHGLSEQELMTRLGVPGQPAEGRFLPETYVFAKGSSDLDLLRRAHASLARTLDEVWAGRAQDLPLTTPDEALTLASIIEKETGRADERPLIAAVFLRRLRLGMRLQTDPTVIYGLGAGFDGNLRRRDLDADTPYNTYTRAGLPPTPIALPGRAAIEAAVHPADSHALYFVARGDGSHEFTDSLDAHNRAVAKYQLHR